MVAKSGKGPCFSRQVSECCIGGLCLSLYASAIACCWSIWNRMSASRSHDVDECCVHPMMSHEQWYLPLLNDSASARRLDSSSCTCVQDRSGKFLDPSKPSCVKASCCADARARLCDLDNWKMQVEAASQHFDGVLGGLRGNWYRLEQRFDQIANRLEHKRTPRAIDSSPYQQQVQQVGHSVLDQLEICQKHSQQHRHFSQHVRRLLRSGKQQQILSWPD